jgi:hypothetical protein
MDNLNQVLQHLDELEALLKQHDAPGANASAMTRIDYLTARLRGVDAYISEKAGQLKELAGMYYSARRHLKYPGGSASLYSAIRYDLPGRIRDQAEYIARSKKEPE